jgi:LuxR family maltose regulon positive regulatory protein
VRLAREQPGLVNVLHRRAASWAQEHGLADEAVRHALAAGEAGWAARLVERQVDGSLLRSEGATLNRWLASLPADLITSRPRLLLTQARMELLRGGVERAGELLDAAERALDAAGPGGGDDEPYEPSVGGTASLLANVPATIALDRAYLAEPCGDADGAFAFAERARAEIGEDEWMLASHATGYVGLAELLRGRLAEAERTLGATIAQWRSAGERYLAVRGCRHLGQVQRAQGRLDAALETYRRALEISTTAALLTRLVAAQRTAGTAASGVPLDCLARLLRALGAGQAAPRSRRGAAAVPGMVEPLTARELEVLGLLAAGRSNQRIAEELVISLDTVKKHVGRVLDKLGAGNRTEATARARELGLIP